MYLLTVAALLTGGLHCLQATTVGLSSSGFSFLASPPCTLASTCTVPERGSRATSVAPILAATTATPVAAWLSLPKVPAIFTRFNLWPYQIRVDDGLTTFGRFVRSKTQQVARGGMPWQLSFDGTAVTVGTGLNLNQPGAGPSTTTAAAHLLSIVGSPYLTWQLTQTNVILTARCGIHKVKISSDYTVVHLNDGDQWVVFHWTLSGKPFKPASRGDSLYFTAVLKTPSLLRVAYIPRPLRKSSLLLPMQSAKSRCTVPKIPGSNGSRDGCPGLDLMTLVSYARTYPTQVAYEVSYLDRQIDHQFKTRHIPKWPSMAKSRSPQLLMLALPHHIDRFHAPTFLTGTSGYVAPKGAMAAVLGDVWYERIGPADTDTLKNLMKTNQFPTNPIHEAFTSLTGYNPLDEINRDLRRLVIELTEPKAGQSSWGKLDSFMVILNKWFSPETKPESVPNFVTEDDVWDVGYERRRGLSHGLIVWASMQVAQYVSARKRKDTEKLDGAAWLTEHSEALQQLVDDYITIEPSRSEGLIYHGMDFYEGHASSPGTLVDSFGISLTTVSEALMAYYGASMYGRYNGNTELKGRALLLMDAQVATFLYYHTRSRVAT